MPSKFDVDYFLVDQILPRNRPHIIAGASGAGKTTLLVQMCREALDGKAWFGHPVQPDMKIGYIGTDRNSEAYRHKFSTMGIKPFPIHRFLDAKKYRPSQVKANPMDWLETAYKMGDKPDMLVIDPLSCFLPAKIADYHANADCLVLMSQFCKELGTTLVGSYHAGKLKQDQGFMRPQDRILGSGALLAFSDTQIFLTDATEVHKQPGYHLLTINPHDAPMEEHKLCRVKGAGTFEPWVEADEYVREQRVLKAIPFEPDRRATSDIVAETTDALDLSERSIRRILKQLEDSGSIKAHGYGYYSRLKMS